MKGKVVEVKEIRNKKQIIVAIEGSTLIYVADEKVFANANIDLTKNCPKVGDEIFFSVGKQQGNQVTINKILTENVLSREECFEKVTLPLRSVSNNNQRV